jgi:hypothetical protein
MPDENPYAPVPVNIPADHPMLDTSGFVDLRAMAELYNFDAAFAATVRDLGEMALAATKALTPLHSPLRDLIGDPAYAAKAAAADAARLERIGAEVTCVTDEHRGIRNRAASPAVAAVLAIHRPYAGYDRIHCTECRESDWDGAAAVDWPCATYTAIKENTP